MTGSQDAEVQMRRVALSLAIVVLSALAACTADDEPTTTDVPHVATEPTTPPIPTPTDDEDQVWRIDAQGVGPIRIGTSLRETNAATGKEFAATNFGDFDGRCYSASAPGVPGIVLQVEPAARPTDPLDGPIAVIYVSDSRYRTTENVGVESTEADVRAAYPGVQVRPDEYNQSHHVMTVADDSIHFETDGATVISIQVGSYRVEGCA